MLLKPACDSNVSMQVGDDDASSSSALSLQRSLEAGFSMSSRGSEPHDGTPQCKSSMVQTNCFPVTLRPEPAGAARSKEVELSMFQADAIQMDVLTGQALSSLGKQTSINLELLISQKLVELDSVRGVRPAETGLFLRRDTRVIRCDKSLACNDSGVIIMDFGQDGGMLGLEDDIKGLHSIISNLESTVSQALDRLDVRSSGGKESLHPDNAELATGAQESKLSPRSLGTGTEVLGYLRKVVGLLEGIKESLNADASRVEAAENELRTLRKLLTAISFRLRPQNASIDSDLEAAVVSGESQGLYFDSKVDDDEVLLSLFREVDADGDGLITMEELLGCARLQQKEYSEMAKELHQSLGCNTEAFEEALATLNNEDFGFFQRENVKASIAAVFQAATSTSTIPADHRACEVCRAATRKDIEQLMNELGHSESLSNLVRALGDLASTLDKDACLDFLVLKKAVSKMPRVSGQRLAWIRAIGLDAALARHLPPGTLDDGLEGIKRSLDDEAAEQALQAFFCDARRMFFAAVRSVRCATGSTSARECNSKFQGFTGSFASLSDFHAGAEETMKLGYPNPEIEKGIMIDHSAHPSALRLFVTPNYRIVTCLLVEYWWALDPNFSLWWANDPTLKQLIDPQLPQKVRRILAGELSKGYCDNSGERGSSAELIFPGEVGDSFEETAVSVLIQRSAADINISEAELSSKIISAEREILRTNLERARGLKIIDSVSYLQMVAKRKNIIKPISKACIDQEESRVGAGIMTFGLVLPMTNDAAEQRYQTVQAVVAAALGLQDDDASITLATMWGMTCKYCLHTDVTSLRKRLVELSYGELKKTAENEWGVVDSLSRDDLCTTVVESFIQRELQHELTESMKHASASQLNEVLVTWGLSPPPATSREAQISLIALSMSTEERWSQISGWVELFCRRMQGRTKLGLHHLMQQRCNQIDKVGLQRGEVFATLLYTGPVFAPYNSIYRSFPPHMVQLMDGDDKFPRNTLSTTLFCISSALVKLGRHTDLPENSKVYRGLGNMLLPSQFWVEHGQPAWKGGVERAIMSTTRDKDVALHYSGGKGMIVEISVGRIAIGGDVSWLSMVTVKSPDRPAMISFCCSHVFAIHACLGPSQLTIACPLYLKRIDPQS